MVGHTLHDIRRSVESLETDDGAYHIICARTGTSPVPIAGRRFDSRHTARAALRFAEQYRAALRRYDPQLPYHDLIVCEAPETYTSSERRPETRQRWRDGRTNRLRTVRLPTDSRSSISVTTLPARSSRRSRTRDTSA
ncbi:hypothetical protein [Haladaptatus sp. R4]|uniref:DUF7552 domain-containing protein n=1 Tax=Haladaptatus sp. R4 TaxID=1679489 RepID=UPI000AA5F116|nr:hypothetical protein [Haladaptatus sp. R4]